uniref:Solute carrier family 35 member B1 n=1 Tax=Acrobeloides nanus TaxID=290746 RepID=A0A914ED50_9BILA
MSTTLERNARRSWFEKAMHLFMSGGGIVVCYTAFSYYLERITKYDYGPNKEKFTYMQSLVFMQCLVNGFIAFLMKNRQRSTADNVPWYMYSFCATSYMLAMLLSSWALEWVAYPTQVLGKACKPIPIMIFGVLFAHKKYAWRKYGYVFLIVFGMAIFMYKGSKKGSDDGGLFQFGLGEFFVLLSLLMDGTTGAVQDRIRHYYRTDKWTMMFYMNLFSSIILTMTMIFSDELTHFLSFVRRYPFVGNEIVMISISSALGQCCIFKTVAEFGPLTCSIVTTLRKLFSLVFSIVLFSHPYSNNQMVGTALVFFALILDALESRNSHRPVANGDTPAPRPKTERIE